MPDREPAHPAALPWRGSAWPGLFSNACSDRDRVVSPFPQYGPRRPEWKAGLLRHRAITTLVIDARLVRGSVSKTVHHLLHMFHVRR